MIVHNDLSVVVGVVVVILVLLVAGVVGLLVFFILRQKGRAKSDMEHLYTDMSE